MVEIYLNGEKKQVPQDISLDKLLELFSLPSQRIAVELNKGVVSKRDWPATAIKESDRIEVVHFVGGG